ncbi:MAG: AmmeMemoRadiSam system protein B, partial [Patescibacteria group bacterium]
AIYFSAAGIKSKNIFLVFRARPESVPLAAVMPHHDLVKDVRRKFMEELSLKSRPRTIILVSVNHFNSGRGDIITSGEDWLVANGTKKITADRAVINSLKDSGLVKIEPAAFLSEHGIKNLLAEVKEFFPDSSLVPLIIKEPAKPDDIKKLFEALKSSCSACGLIASVDMSHYQPARLAEIHDVKTLRALTALDMEQIWQTETDSNAALALLALWSKAKNLTRFNLYAQTNSGLMAKNLEAEATTHIFASYSAGEPAKGEDKLSFSFAGDSMFGRNVGYYFQKNNFKDLFSNLGNRALWGTDISWLNLEGPISDKNVEQFPLDHSLSFNFSRQTIEALKYLKITAAGLANNHTDNQGRAGLNKTKEILEKAKIDWVGDPNEASDISIKRYKQGDLTVALLGAHVLYGASGIEELIKEEKNKNNFVIILPHWGNEYQPTHSASQEKLARAWIAAGADLIIGAHPHVVQDAQIINGKLVFYSLGNFIFDQMFSRETQEGLILGGTISAEKIKIVLVPIISKKMKPEIMRGADRRKMIDKICRPLGEYCREDIIEL